MKNKNSIIYTVVVMAAIASGVVLMLSLVNTAASPIIESREEAEIEAAIHEIYSDFDALEEEHIEMDIADTIYVVIQSDKTNYCVLESPAGFSSDIQMLVGVTSDLKVKGVKIVSLSETVGVGTRVNDDAFLETFIGTDKQTVTDVDTLSGATVSSKAVKRGVANAIDAVALQFGNAEG